MHQGIKKRLLSRLFISPKPLSPQQFKEASPCMFPVPDDFVSFLEAEHTDELRDYARRIIWSFCYSRTFAPPTRLLNNLAGFQDKRVSHPESGSHVPRDHFVHLAFLYLLGCYFFSYHNRFHQSCLSEFRRRKKNIIKSKKLGDYNLIKNGYQLFSELWSYFVLYHDLTYPLECTPPKQRINNPKNRDFRFLNPFWNLNKSFQKDLTLKAVSRILVARYLTCGGNQMSLKDHYFDDIEVDYKNPPKHLSSESSLTDFLKIWGKSLSLSRIEGYRCLGDVLSVFGFEPICAVLENVETGEALAAVFRFNNEPVELRFSVDPGTQQLKIPPTVELHNLAFIERKTPKNRVDVRWVYFGKNIENEYDKIVGRIFEICDSGRSKGEINGQTSLNDLYENIISSDTFVEMRYRHPDSSRSLGYRIFMELARLLNYDKPSRDEDLSKKSAVQRKIELGSDSVERELPSITARYLEKYLMNKFRSKDKKIAEKFLKEQTGPIADWLYGEIACKEFKSKITELIEKEIGEIFKEKIKLENSARHVKDGVRRFLLKRIGEENEDFFAASVLNPDFSLAEWHDLLKDEKDVNLWNELILKLRYGTFPELLKTYIGWGEEEHLRKENNLFCDHGLAASILTVISLKHLETYLNRDSEMDSRKKQSSKQANLESTARDIVRIAMGITGDRDRERQALEKELIKIAVVPVIAAHNLYPSKLLTGRRDYRTSFEREPFQFMAIFTDALQKWDREDLVTSDTWVENGIVPGRHFDLRIEGDRVRVVSKNVRIGESLKRDLEDFLSDIGSIVVEDRSER